MTHLTGEHDTYARSDNGSAFVVGLVDGRPAGTHIDTSGVVLRIKT